MGEKDNVVIGAFLGMLRDQKEEWIARARASFVPSLRGPCFVCGKFRAITHAHHLTPLATQYARGWREFGRRLEADHSHVWLCPNHHAVLHAFIDEHEIAAKTETAIFLMEGTTQEERGILLDLYARAFK